MVNATRLPIAENANATAMANEIFGDGVTVVAASYSGDNRASGIYSNGDTVSPDVTPSDTGVILSTGRVRNFTNTNGEANQSTATSSNTSGVNNNPDFNALAGTSTFDAAILDVDFIPTSDFLTMQFVFASEEYPEFQNSIYQDAVGVWVNGAPVDLAIGNGDTDPGNINNVSNQNLYFDNTADQYNTEMDGFTVTMTLTMAVTPNVLNSIRIGIADVSDSSYDSALLIAGNSVQSAIIARADAASVYVNGSVNIDVLGNDTTTSGGTLTVTHVNGQAVVAGSTITLATGESVTLNADGTLTFQNDADLGAVNFTYSISDGINSDTGFVNVASIPCFVSGTRILTPRGEVTVESLQPGDLVMTRDAGAQRLRWIGGRTVSASGDFAPILIRAGTFGAHRNLLVSPQHRVLIRDYLAELLFGEAEVLVAAKDLVNGHSVVQKAGGFVTYIHLMFDRHQVVFSEGLETESFLPGPQTNSIFDKPVLDEICALFPELDPETGEGYSPAARRILRHYEARLLSPALARAA
jgi:hypothetical protein